MGSFIKRAWRGLNRFVDRQFLPRKRVYQELPADNNEEVDNMGKRRVIKVKTTADPAQVAAEVPGKVLASKPASKGKESQKRLVYRTKDGELKQSTNGGKVQSVNVAVQSRPGPDKINITRSTEQIIPRERFDYAPRRLPGRSIRISPKVPKLR